jgi:predicted permease
VRVSEVWRRIVFLFRRGPLAAELEEEMQLHLELRAKKLSEQGIGAQEAIYTARRRFGNKTKLQEVSREIWGWNSLERLVRDIQYAFRSLIRNPAFVVTAILLLGLSIGANTALFTIANQVLLRTLPIKNPRQIVSFNWRGQFIGGSSRGWQDRFSYPAYADLRGANPDVFTGIAAEYQADVDIIYKGPAQRGVAELVSGNYFKVLGVTTALGRPLTSNDDKGRGGEPYVVLSYQYWQRRFAGDPSVLNSTLDLNGHPMTIVGIAQRGFAGYLPMTPTDVFVPMMMKAVATPTWDDMARRDSIWLRVFARLKPGVSIQYAAGSVAIPFHNALENDLKTNGRNRDFSHRYLKNSLVIEEAAKGAASIQEQFANPLYVLATMVGIILLIACVNVANLFIARASGRGKEVGIRLSLGASRASLIRLIMLESLLIAAFSGILGLLLSNWLAAAFVRLLPFENIDVAISTRPDGTVLAFTAALSIITAVLFGLLPAFQVTRPDVSPGLKNESSTISLSSGQTRLRRLLVSGEIALSLWLLFGAGLFARSLHRLMATDTGMNVSRLLAFTVDPSLHKYTPERSRRLFRDFEERIRAIPGVVAASGASVAVLADNNWQNGAHVEGYQRGVKEDFNPGWSQMLPGFFSTMGVPIVAGREFTDGDVAGRPEVVIVNETFVKRYVHGNALGLHLGWGDSGPMPFEIVGVVRDMKGGDLKEEAKPWTYTAALQNKDLGAMTFYVRTAKNPNAMAPSRSRSAATPRSRPSPVRHQNTGAAD